MQRNHSKPDVFDFVDHKEYLRVRLLLPSNSKGLSLRNFATRAGFRSSATLSMVINGNRRLTPAVANRLAKALRLTGRRKTYFMQMSQRSMAESVEDQAQHEEAMFKIRNAAQAKHLDTKQYHMLSKWYYVTIYVLAGIEKLSRNSTHISQRINGRVPPSEVEQAIADLIAIDLLREESGTLVQTQGPLIKTTEDVRNLAIQKFHREMIELGVSSLAAPLEEREITALTAGIPLSALPQLKEKIRQFREDLDQFIDGLGPADEVYQLNIQFFALTKKGLSKQKRSRS